MTFIAETPFIAPTLKTAGGPLGAYQAQSAGDMAAGDERVMALTRNRNEYPLHYWGNPFVGGPIAELTERLHRRVSASRATSPAMAVTSAMFPLNPLSWAGYPIAGIQGDPARKTKTREMYHKLVDPGDSEAAADALTVKDLEAERLMTEPKPKPKPKPKLKPKTEKMKVKAAGIFSPTGPYAIDQGSQVLAADKRLMASLYNEHHHPAQWWLNPVLNGPVTGMLERGRQRRAATQATSPTAAVLANLPLPDIGIEGLADIDVSGMADGMSTIIGGAKRRHQARSQMADAKVDDYDETQEDSASARKIMKHQKQIKAAASILSSILEPALMSGAVGGVLGGGIGGTVGLGGGMGHGQPASGMGRGVIRGAGAGAGALMGGSLGAAPGMMTGSPGLAMLGSLLGMGVGGVGGYRLGRNISGENSWEKKPKSNSKPAKKPAKKQTTKEAAFSRLVTILRAA